jgi:hypothetical protein
MAQSNGLKASTTGLVRDALKAKAFSAEGDTGSAKKML